MELTLEESKELIKFLSYQFIDLNGKKLYDGQIIRNILFKAIEEVEQDKVVNPNDKEHI